MAWCRHVHRELHLVGGGRRYGVITLRRCLGDDGATVHNLRLQPTAFAQLVGVVYRHLHVGLRVLVTRVQIGREEIVANLRLWCRPEEAAAVDARQSPVVLALEERAAGETVDLQGQRVFTLGDVVGNPKLRRQVRVLRVANALTVHPEIISVTHTVEAHVDVAVLPGAGDGKGAAVGAHGVGHRVVVGVVAGTAGHDREGLLVIGERVPHPVHVQRLVPRHVVVQSPHLPARWHVDGRPAGVGKVLGAPGVLGVRGVAHPLELPLAVQRLEPGRQRHVVLGDVGLRRYGYGDGVSRLAVHAGYQGVVPLLAGLCADVQASHCHQGGKYDVSLFFPLSLLK